MFDIRNSIFDIQYSFFLASPALRSVRVLAKEGFFVLPYIPADPVLARRLEDVGCAAVMPLGAAIGSGQGLTTSSMLKLMIRDSAVPVIVDATAHRRAWRDAARVLARLAPVVGQNEVDTGG